MARNMNWALDPRPLRTRKNTPTTQVADASSKTDSNQTEEG